jgi:hypothetical protein
VDQCIQCGSEFRRTKKSRKYCTSRCRTNACLAKNPRLTVAEVGELRALLGEEFKSLDGLRERLRAIVAPELPPIPVLQGGAAVPRLD